MRNGLLIVAAILLVAESSFAQGTTGAPQTPAPAANSVMKLDDATPVLLRTKEALSSATAKVGDRVPFRVTENVKAGDLIVIQRGAEAWGVVTAVQPKKRKGQPGSVDVSIQSVQLLSGDRALLRAKRHLEGADKTGRMVNDMEQFKSEVEHDKGAWGAPSEVVALPLLPLFLLERGEDVRLPAGTKVTAYLNGDVPLDRGEYERVQPAIAPRTGPATVTIFRESIHYASAYKPSVYCGKIALARLPSGGYLKIQLPQGKYSFRSNDDQAVELQLEDGQEIYVQMQIVTHGLSAKGHLTQVSSSEGEDEIASLSELSGKDVAKVSDANLADLQTTPEKK
jgi:hypothetical protein